MLLSLVIPLYNEELIVAQLFERTINVMKLITNDFEIICVNDGSSDSTLEKLLFCHQQDSRFKVIDLSRNFGHQAAYTAGLTMAKGNYIAMLDGDLQDPPEVITEMYKKITTEKYDIIYGKRTSRNEGTIRKFTTSIFHLAFKKLGNINDPSDVGNFSLFNRKALNAFLQLTEKNRYLPGLRYFIGFNQGFVEYDRPNRKIGKTKMSFFKLLTLGFDAIFSFSKLPLRFSLIFGLFGISLSLFGAAIVIYKKLIGDAITGWSSTMLSIFFLGSVQLFFLGILGEYVFRIFKETMNRPVYIIKDYYE